jgi:hypothetical protein
VVFPIESGNPLSLSPFPFQHRSKFMNSIVYIVGLVVIIGAILAFLGLR